jgi:hypothetical protein
MSEAVIQQHMVNALSLFNLGDRSTLIINALPFKDPNIDLPPMSILATFENNDIDEIWEFFYKYKPAMYQTIGEYGVMKVDEYGFTRDYRYDILEKGE